MGHDGREPGQFRAEGEPDDAALAAGAKLDGSQAVFFRVVGQGYHLAQRVRVRRVLQGRQFFPGFDAFAAVKQHQASAALDVFDDVPAQLLGERSGDDMDFVEILGHSFVDLSAGERYRFWFLAACLDDIAGHFQSLLQFRGFAERPQEDTKSA